MNVTDERSTDETPAGHAWTQPSAAAPARTESRRPGWRRVVPTAVLAVALLGGGTYVVAQQGSSGSTTAGGTTAANGAPNGAANGAGPGGGGAGTGGSMAAPPQGTVVSTTANSVTVKLSSGTTTTYTLGSGATVEIDGATSTLSKLTAGETIVVLNGQPGSTSTVATRILAGTSATAGPGGGRPPGAAA